MATSIPPPKTSPVRPVIARAASNWAGTNGRPAPSVIASTSENDYSEAVLELADGSAFRGLSFGAQGKSVAGECVFQTGKCNCFRRTRRKY
jgi:carbamoyl-phosphate synthase/aspartate carbamoyltransferase